MPSAADRRAAGRLGRVTRPRAGEGVGQPGTPTLEASRLVARSAVDIHWPATMSERFLASTRSTPAAGRPGGDQRGGPGSGARDHAASTRVHPGSPCLRQLAVVRSARRTRDRVFCWEELTGPPSAFTAILLSAVTRRRPAEAAVDASGPPAPLEVTRWRWLVVSLGRRRRRQTRQRCSSVGSRARQPEASGRAAGRAPQGLRRSGPESSTLFEPLGSASTSWSDRTCAEAGEDALGTAKLSTGHGAMPRLEASAVDLPGSWPEASSG